jgi:preprotein translocase subunit SecY
MPDDQLIGTNPVRELAKRFLITFLLGVVVYRLGVVVPIPGVNAEVLKGIVEGALGGEGNPLGAMLRYADMFNGGAIGNASIFGLGIMPYISASIIFQLLAFSFPALKELQKEGEVGRRKINQYTRYATVLICAVQSGLAAAALLNFQGDGATPLVVTSNPTLFIIQSIIVVTTGSMVLLWIGEQITKHGVGNGVSVIIMISILSSMPGAIGNMIQNEADVAQFFFVLLLMIAIIAAMIIITLARRRINLEQQRRVQGNRVYGGQQTSLPLMLNQANVIPVIFASPVILVLGTALGNQWVGFGGFIDYGTAGYRYLMAGLIIFFTYFYISITFDLNDMANHFKQAGFFIRGVKPGRKTVEYLQYRVTRITFVGAIALAAVAITPDILGNLMQLSQEATRGLIGGIGLLIVVGVSLDVIQKVGAFMMANQYQSLMSGGAAGGKAGLAPAGKSGKRF